MGAEVGIEVGTEDGAEVGIEVGTEDGTEDGTEVGIEVGTEDGTEVGIDVGTEDGAEVGIDVGTEDGTEVGIEVGTEDGTEVGIDVGTEDGADVGIDVGGYVSPVWCYCPSKTYTNKKIYVLLITFAHTTREKEKIGRKKRYIAHNESCMHAISSLTPTYPISSIHATISATLVLV